MCHVVLQAIALLDTLDKDVNTFVMRVREWYSWHFPELVKVRLGLRRSVFLALHTALPLSSVRQGFQHLASSFREHSDWYVSWQGGSAHGQVGMLVATPGVCVS